MEFNATVIVQMINFIILIAIIGGILTIFLKLIHYQKRTANELTVIRKILENNTNKPKE
jgi:hypothetical protein